MQEALASAVAKVIKEQPTDPVASIARYLMQVETQRSEARMMAEIATMSGPQGFDFLIVCCSNLAAENYWQKRLESTVKEVTGAAGVVLCVHEDWNGGAGNGLGTLYAFQKACAKGSASGIDLAGALRGGSSVALYHTAGKGTRLAPLPGAENNNKPGVKLPALIQCDGEPVPITVLECVMRQTSSYAAARKGRCSVFWGDQSKPMLGGFNSAGRAALARSRHVCSLRSCLLHASFARCSLPPAIATPCDCCSACSD